MNSGFTPEQETKILELSAQGWSGSKIAQEIGSSKGGVNGYLRRRGLSVPSRRHRGPRDPALRQANDVAPQGKTTMRTRTLEDFRRANDETWKIRNGIKQLLKSGIYMTDSEFRDAVRGNTQRWRASADAREFEENRFRYKGEVLWASAETLKEMKDIVGVGI